MLMKIYRIYSINFMMPGFLLPAIFQETFSGLGQVVEGWWRYQGQAFIFTQQIISLVQ
jgi:hypothetical protein